MPNSLPDLDGATLVLAIAYAVFTVLAGLVGIVVHALIVRTESREAVEPLDLNKVIVCSEVRTMDVILRTFLAFNMPIFLLFLISIWLQNETVTFIEYCAGIAFSTFVLAVALYRYWKRRYLRDFGVIRYLFS